MIKKKKPSKKDILIENLYNELEQKRLEEIFQKPKDKKSVTTR
jgi:hypothetical protein